MSTSNGHGAGGGKSAQQMHEEHRQHMDAAFTITRCMCGWTYEGTAAKGRELAKDHRRKHHPEIKPVRRRRGSLQRFSTQDDFQQEGLARARKVAESLARLEEAS